MSGAENYDLWLGSDLGLLKGVTLSKDSFTNYGDIKTLDRSQSITCMAFHKQDKQNNLLVGLQSGVVKTYDTATNEYTTAVTNHESPVRGLFALADGSIVSCTESGNLQRWKDGESVLEKNLGPDIKSVVASHTPEIFAVGGIENDIKVYQVENIDKPLFSAKNVKNDMLNLRVPVWVSAMAFFKKDTNKLVVASGHHTVRVYDRREKRRPAVITNWHDHPITALALKPNNSTVILGNSAGFMGELDLRTGKQVGGFKGNAGSIRSIVYHPTQPLIASCGLDRFLKIYDTGTRKIIKKIYTKSALNCMVMTSSQIQLSPTAEKRSATADDEVEEDEQIWSAMETVKKKEDSTKKKKKRKKKA